MSRIRGCFKFLFFVLVLSLFFLTPKVKLMYSNFKVKSASDLFYSFKENINNFYMAQLIHDNSFSLNGVYSINDGSLVDEYDNSYSVIGSSSSISGYLSYDNNNLMGGCVIVDGFSFMIVDDNLVSTDDCESNMFLASNF